MTQRSVSAYDNESRVRRYDRDMDLMHPNRHRMVGVALEILSENEGHPSKVLDLGTGTGFFAARFLERHLEANLVALDGAASMIELARTRLETAGVADRARLLASSFEDFDPVQAEIGQVDIILSSFALHHLHLEAKRDFLCRIVSILKPGGWFLNADLVSHPDPETEAVIQRIRVDGIVARNAASTQPDPRFENPATVRALLDDLERSEGDCPLHLGVDLDLFREAGIADATVFWQEYREVLFGGRKRQTHPQSGQ